MGLKAVILSTLEKLLDVVVTTPTNGQVLIWNGTSWVNSSDPITRGIYFTADGAGSVLTTGVKSYIYISVPCTITSSTLLADQSGSCVVDIWKAAYSSFPPLVANSIVASAPPTLSSAQKSQDTTLTGWTTPINAGDVLAFNINSATSVTRINLALKVTVT